MKNRAARLKETAPQADASLPPPSAMPEGALFLLSAVAIVFFGLIMLYSTSYVIFGFSYFTKQMIWAAVGVAAMAVTQSRTHSSLYILYTTHYYILGKKREVRKKSRKLFCHISLTVDKSLFALYNTSRYFKVGPVRPPRTAILRYQYAYFTRLSLTESRVFRFSERYQNKRRAAK